MTNTNKEEMSKKKVSTPVDACILDSFKEKCKNDNITMSKVLELFMKHYIDGDFILVFRKNDDNIVDRDLDLN